MEVKCAKKKGRGGETNGGLFIKKISTQTCGGSFVSLYNWTVGGMEVMTNTQEIVPNRTFVALCHVVLGPGDDVEPLTSASPFLVKQRKATAFDR